jgi:hypothetical protein
MGAYKNGVTLKALANASPGFALKPWVQKCPRIVRNPEGVAVLRLTKADTTPSELRLRELRCLFPGLPERNPGLELANAFSVIHFL